MCAQLGRPEVRACEIMERDGQRLINRIDLTEPKIL